MNGNYLYASYTGNYSLATYQIGDGCQLSWIGSIPIIVLLVVSVTALLWRTFIG